MNYRIKICGITRVEDARLAVDLGAFALGFIFYEKSPRFIDPESVAEILKALETHANVLKVGVFVNKPAEEIRDWKERSGIDVIQLHGDESPDFAAKLAGERIWRAIRLQNAEQLASLAAYKGNIEAFLFDAAVPGEYGGTGHRLNEGLIQQIPRDRDFILAGGLGPENWREMYDRHRPFGIDLSSAVESRPGIKDGEKLRKLFAQKG